MRENPRTLRQLPASVLASIDRFEPRFTMLDTDVRLPIRAKLRSESELPRVAKPITLKLLPNRPKLRVDMLDPRSTKFKMDMLDPTRVCAPKIEIADDIRVAARKLMELPKCPKCSTEIAEPNRVVERRLMVEPQQT
jgi:hypothetical protein